MTSKHDLGLVGEWTKLSREPCAARYPAQLRFEPGGLYFGESDGGLATWWDQGTWQTPSAGEIAVSTFNDAVVHYRYRLDGDALEFTDAQECRFQYQRAR